jgi:large subunit ribosomal protein L13
MKIIDGTDATLGRLASYAAKQALQGEEIVVLNCEKVIITGKRKSIFRDFDESRSRVGSSQKGPKISRLPERIVKRVIRGMLPDHRMGRGRGAWKRIKCYKGVPKEFVDKKAIISGKAKHSKFVYVGEFAK